MEQCLGFPPKQGLYDPQNERDNCGVGFVVNVKGQKSHDIVQKGLEVLINLTHRGAAGSDANTGDGAGILLQIPHEFFVKEAAKLDFNLPELGDYAVGMVFLPNEPEQRLFCEGILERIIREEGLDPIGWRDVPVDNANIGVTAKGTQPLIRQIFVARGKLDQVAFERRLYVVRKRTEQAVRDKQEVKNPEYFYICSLSSRTVVYKGLLFAAQMEQFYLDLSDETFKSAIALVHQRYSTNTFPTWSLAQPFRYLAHNGEINTLRGNVNWMYARQGVLESEVFGDEIEKIFPVISPDQSDSACLDNALELLIVGGRSLSHAAMMLVPEAWEGNDLMDETKRGFYEFHAGIMEPWDGPAGLAFTNGVQVAATLDRNGLRPARYVVTKDDLVVMGSEVGVLEFPAEDILYKGRLQPGKMLLIDTAEGRIINDEELKQSICSQKPYTEWVKNNRVKVKNLPDPVNVPEVEYSTLLKRQQLFGYSAEDLKVILAPMAATGKEPTGSMGNDTPLAVISDKPQPVFNYFKQLFAQVTNPPIDPIREKMVMSLLGYIGTDGNILNESEAQSRLLEIEQPVLTNEDLEKIREINSGDFRVITVPMVFKASEGGDGLKAALKELCERVSDSIKKGYNIIVLSDRHTDDFDAPIPSLLATAAVHHHLIRERTRTKVGLIVETAEAREIMHFALLVGYGATAVNPYLALETLADMARQGLYAGVTDAKEAVKNYIKAIGGGLLKTTSRMGISTLRSYHGAQIFEAIGLNSEVIENYFTGTPSRIEGVGLDVLAKEVQLRHEKAYGDLRLASKSLDDGGQYQWRQDGEHHLFNPETISKLQHSTQKNDYKLYKEYANLVNDQSKKIATLRGLFKLKTDNPISIDEVEPIENIMKRFVTGAMSFGSISREAHEAMAIAMNTIGGRSNTGEGGEDPERFKDNRRSSVKQIASGRFGVTTNYLVNADELQIKMAQGAKPGEGGQLPGHKVDEVVGKLRHSVPGIELISPPPHHDIYSIEDLAQLIHDLKNVNPAARISVKLVSEVGVGTVAAGVSKAHSDVVLISGYDGGTGASPITSIKHAGIPWELGLAETQQVLLLNDLRSRIIVQVDGQMKTGRDVVIAALLGGEEFGFATAALVILGCVMMRKCHLNTCPVGIATQDPELRKKFLGKADYLVNYFRFVAQEVRELMAELGFRTVDEMVGRVDKIEMKDAVNHWKAKGIDFSKLLYKPDVPDRIAPRCVISQDHGLEQALDHKLIEVSLPALEKKEKVVKEFTIKNTNRTVGTMLSGEIAKRYGDEGLADDTITINFKGTAGQSFGAFGAKGLTFNLEGDANDYVGKGLCGAKIAIFPPKNANFDPSTTIIAGNTLLYGATSGELYLNGVVGERFGIRNSGATAVVEGVGDHGCEYMTGGTIAILGETGRNFGAGMSGGVAFVYDEKGNFKDLCNPWEPIELGPVSDAEDLEILHKMVSNHYKYTGSKKAETLLANWDKSLAKFVKVIPTNYREIIERMKKEQQASLNEVAATSSGSSEVHNG